MKITHEEVGETITCALAIVFTSPIWLPVMVIHYIAKWICIVIAWCINLFLKS